MTYKIEEVIVAKPPVNEMPYPVTKPSSRKNSSHSAPTFSMFILSKDIKEIANLDMVIGSLKLPNNSSNFDPPKPIP